MPSLVFFRLRHGLFAALAGLILAVMAPQGASAQVTAFKQAVAEAAARDDDIAAFYRANNYDAIWTDNSSRDKARRAALISALKSASEHGLPVRRYDPAGLMAKLKAAETPRDRGRMEVEMSRVFLQYARDLQTGILTPSKVVDDIKRQVPYRDRGSYLTNFAKSSPKGFFRALAPKTQEYSRLMKAKLTLEMHLGAGGWGPTVPAKSLKPGQSGNAVVALRNRLIAKGYMNRSASQTYDASMQKAVQLFQVDHGLSADGVAGPGTMAEINRGVEDRLQSIIVAMERERWMNKARGKRHILVNLADFSAKVIDNGKLTFKTRAVVGMNQHDRRSPEFSDVMEFMVINPSWYVPRSIATKEYLPQMKRNRNAVSHLEIIDGRGRPVSRSAINFAAYSERSFPFNMRQPPSRNNALGLVKFMFPNKYNIYLHDTPAKNLFSREVRAYSHGCIRLHQPFDFAYTLLAPQTSDPEGFFQAKLKTGAETRVDLVDPVPVHIIYRTAFTTAKGRVNYRRDVYGRDARIWNALANAGVALRAVKG